MSQETVTVLIPTYRRPEKLKRAVASVLAQTYCDLKVLVCDNASGDETEEVIAEIMTIDQRVSYHKHSQNIGMNANFNFAVSRVRTRFFTFLTDDDFYLPNYLMDAMRGFKNYPDIVCSIVRAPTILESGDVLSDQIENWPKEGYYKSGEAMSQLILDRHPIITACVFKTDVRELIIFQEEFGILSDVPLLANVLVNFPLYLTKNVGLYFVRHSNNAGSKPAPIGTMLAVWESISESIENAVKIDGALKVNLLSQLKAKLDNRYFMLLLRAVEERDQKLLLIVFSKMRYVSSKFKLLIAGLICFLCRSDLLMKIFSGMLWRINIVRGKRRNYL